MVKRIAMQVSMILEGLVELANIWMVQDLHDLNLLQTVMVSTKHTPNIHRLFGRS